MKKPTIAALLFVFLFVGVTQANFAIFQTYSADEVAISTCNIATGVVTGAGAPGPCVTTLPTCDGNTANNATPSFTEFHTWAYTQQGLTPGLIELQIPQGSVCMFMSGGNNGCVASCFANAITRLRVVGLGTGAELNDGNGKGQGFFLGTLWGGNAGIETGDAFSGAQCDAGIAETNGCSARIQTVSAGASCVTLTSGSLGSGYVSRFAAGKYILVGGADLQAFGYPTNNQFYEYHLVTSVNAGTGEICFEGTLEHAYKSTWPLYFAGNAAHADQGGPGTIWDMGLGFNMSVEYRNLTINQSGAQTDARAYSVIYRNVTVASGSCIIPSQNVVMKFINVTDATCNIEVDKNIGEWWIINSTMRGVHYQSPAPRRTYIQNSTFSGNFNGGGYNNYFSDTTLTNWQIGPQAYGYSNETTCTNCVITGTIGPLLNSTGKGAPAAFMTANVINIPKPTAISAAANNGSGKFRLTVGSSAGWITGQTATVAEVAGGTCGDAAGEWTVTVIDGTHVDLDGSTFNAFSPTTCNLYAGTVLNQYPAVWAAPGGNYYMSFSGNQNPPPLFQITDMSEDSTFLKITTNGIAAGVFPTVGGSLTLHPHAAPIFTCTNCTGSTAAIALSQNATPGAPLGSSSSVSMTSVVTSLPLTAWGYISQIIVDVTTAYAGASSINVNINGPFISNTDGTRSIWNPTVNPKQKGQRIIAYNKSTLVTTVTCDGSPGACSGDSIADIPEEGWVSDDQITAQFSSVPGDLGTTAVTVTVKTDQGVVIP